MSIPRKSLKNPRTLAFIKQHGQCYYCGSLMWRKDPSELVNRFKISRNQSLLLQCTGEHLLPHSSGGNANPENIVAACKFCNQGRHKKKNVKPPQEFRKFVHSRLAKRRWNSCIRPN